MKLGRVSLLMIKWGNLNLKLDSRLVFSWCFFLLCWSLDYYITNVGSNGDSTLEGNFVARLWWEIMGSFRFIEFPIWAAVVLIMALLINTKSKFLALLWLNFVALQNLLGFMTWLPYGTLDFLYRLPDWAVSYAISLISICLASPVAFLQARRGCSSSPLTKL